MTKQKSTSIDTPSTIKRFDVKGGKLCAVKLFTLGNVDTWIAWLSGTFTVGSGFTMHEALGELVVKLADEDPKKN